MLLLDEPFGALDAKVRKELRRWLRRLHDELHISSIFVTHDQEEALEVADRVVLMNKGSIEQIGSPWEIYNQPATPFAHSFIGTVNEFRGQIEGASLRVGGDLLAGAPPGMSDGAKVIAFARPHDTQILPHTDAQQGIAARVNRILSSGALSKVELVANGAVRAGYPQYFEVEVSADEIARLGLHTGKHVRLASRRLAVFNESTQGQST